MLPGFDFSPDDILRIMKVRMRDIDVKENFPNWYDNNKCSAPQCFHAESQRHIFFCEYLNSIGELSFLDTQYEDIYSDDTAKMF